METTKIVACIFLVFFLNLATFDGLYLHLYKYKLHAWKESRREHFLHTINAFIFPWTIFFVFLDEFKGLLLWFGVLLTLISLLVEYFDLFEENKSRESFGGLTSLEYALHMAMGSLRASYISLILVSKPLADWSLSGSSFVESYANAKFNLYFIYPMLMSCLFVGFLHIFLLLNYRERKLSINQG